MTRHANRNATVTPYYTAQELSLFKRITALLYTAGMLSVSYIAIVLYTA